ncbi:MAG: phosphatase domain-containing protein [Planctomycetota bacterium]
MAESSLRNIVKEKKFLAMLLVYLVFLGALIGAHLTATVSGLKISGFDSIAAPGEKITLAAKAELDVPGRANPDRKGISLRFRISLGSGLPVQELHGITDGEGIARVEIKAPEKPGTYFFEIIPQGSPSPVKTSRIPPKLVVLTQDSPILVCDIDDTITAGGGWKMLISSGNLDPLPGAPEELRHLASQYRLVYLTARDEALLNDTRDWLAKLDFPAAPVICRDWQLGKISKAGEFKAKVLKSLKQRFPNILWGIGNSSGDCHAYQANGIPHLTLESSRCASGAGVSCQAVRDWTEIGALLRK